MRRGSCSWSRRRNQSASPALMWRAATRLGIAGTAIEPAARAGLLDVGAQVRFRHPLVRSTVYRSASDARAPDRAPGAGGGDRCLRSSRIAARGTVRRPREGPDEEVASELERSAGRAQARGGLAAAAAFLARAAELTVDPVPPCRAHAGGGAGQPAGRRVRGGARTAGRRRRPGRWTSSGEARVDLLHAEIAFAQNRGQRRSSAAAPSREGARDAGRAALARHLSGRMERGTVRRAAGERRQPARGLAGGGDRPRSGGPAAPVAICCWTASRSCSPRGASPPTPVLQRAATAFAGRRISVEEVLRWGWLATAAAVFVWDYDTCLAVATREVQLARESGALEVLAVGVNVLGQAVALGGDFASRRAPDRRGRCGHGGHRGPRRPLRARSCSRLPRPEAEASELIEATIREATAGGQGTAVQYAHWANAVRHERSRPLRGGARGGHPRRARTHRSCSSPRGRSAS